VRDYIAGMTDRYALAGILSSHIHKEDYALRPQGAVIRPQAVLHWDVEIRSKHMPIANAKTRRRARL